MGTAKRAPRRDRQRNRAALLAAARELFAERGLDVPLDTIAKRAGVGNATLYRHFPDPNQLIAEVLIANLSRGEEALKRALGRPSGWEGFVDYMRWLFSEQIDNAAYMTALRAVPAGTNAQVDDLRNRTLTQLEGLISRAKDERRFRRDRWIEDVFLFLALNEQLTHSGHGDPHSASRRFLELLLSAVVVGGEQESGAATEPPAVLALRRTLGTELAGLPAHDRDPRSFGEE